MNAEVALILTVGGIAGSILVSQMWQMNWFNRENFKYNQAISRKENSLRFKKMEKDLGLKAGAPIKTTNTASPMDWIETLKKIDPNVAHNFIDSITGTGGEDYGEDDAPKGIEDTILNIAKTNPELVQNFLSGLGSAKGGQQNNQIVR